MTNGHAASVYVFQPIEIKVTKSRSVKQRLSYLRLFFRSKTRFNLTDGFRQTIGYFRDTAGNVTLWFYLSIENRPLVEN